MLELTTAPLMRWRHFATFVAIGALLALPWTLASWTIQWRVGAVMIGLGIVLAALSAIDVETQRLPDALTLPLIAAGLAFQATIDRDTIWWHAAGAALGYLTLWAVGRAYLAYRGHPGLGLGDAKLLAAAGAWLGPGGLPSVLLIAAFCALAGIGIAWLRGIDVTSRTAIPFGPFLALGLWATWLYGPLA